MTDEKAIVLDFDGTIADYTEREHLRDVDWEAYIAASVNDIPSKPVVEIINRFKNDHKIIILSARSERSREETDQWLKKYNIYYDDLILKPNDFNGEDCSFKSKRINDISKEYEIFFCIDDRSSCVKSLRDEGFYTFQCGEGY